MNVDILFLIRDDLENPFSPIGLEKLELYAKFLHIGMDDPCLPHYVELMRKQPTGRG